MRKRSYRLLSIVCIFIILLLTVVLLSDHILKLMASNLIVEDEVKKSDAIVVLGGAPPSRILEAIDLYNNGLSERILITRGGRPQGYGYLESRGIKYPEEPEVNMYIAGRLNIGDDVLSLIPGRVTGTKEEAKKIRDYTESRGYKALIITTSKFHSKRAKTIFNDVFEESDIKIMIKPTKYDSFKAEEVLENKFYLRNMIYEYQKFLYYYAKELF